MIFITCSMKASELELRHLFPQIKLKEIIVMEDAKDV